MSKKSFTVSLTVLLITILLVVLITRRGEPVVVQTNLDNIPMKISVYKATEDYFSDSISRELDADKYIYRHYRDDSGKEIDLYIGYYGTAKGGRTWHTPHRCLAADGWVVIKSKKIKVSPCYNPEGIDLNHIVARKGNVFVCMLHWYQSAGKKVLSTGFEQNIERFKGRILYNRNDGAFVEVSILTPEKGVQEANLLAKAFAEMVLDLLPNYWPVEE